MALFDVDSVAPSLKASSLDCDAEETEHEAASIGVTPMVNAKATSFASTHAIPAV